MASSASSPRSSASSLDFDSSPLSKKAESPSWIRPLTKIGAVAMCILVTLSGAHGTTSLPQGYLSKGSVDCWNTTPPDLLFDLQSACPNHTWTDIPYYGVDFPRGDACITSLDDAYAAAVEDAKVAKKEEAYPLEPIPNGTVTVVSWIAKKSGITDHIEQELPTLNFRNSLGAPSPRTFTPSISIKIDRPIWVVLEREVRTICRNWNLQGSDLDLRIVQLLGLPNETHPDYKKLAVAIIQIEGEFLRRPCFDIAQDASGTIRCTGPSGQTPHKEAWDRRALCEHLYNSYFSKKNRFYPVTGTGSAFDWHCKNPTDYGTTELVIPPNTTIRVVQALSTDAFCLRT